MNRNSVASSNQRTSCDCGCNHGSSRGSKTSIHPEDVSGVAALVVLVSNLWGFVFFCSWVAGEDDLLGPQSLIIVLAYLNLVYLSCRYVKNYLRNLVVVGGENGGVTKRC